MRIDDGAIVAVRREWNGWRTAMVPVTDLDNVHWFQPARAPRPLIHADVSCTKFLSGDPLQGCPLTPHPHYVRVCLLKCHTPPSVFEELARRAEGGHSERSAGPIDSRALETQRPSRVDRALLARISVLAIGTLVAILGVTWRRSPSGSQQGCPAPVGSTYSSLPADLSSVA